MTAADEGYTMTVMAAAIRRGVSSHTIRNALKAGKLTSRTVARSHFLRESEVMALGLTSVQLAWKGRSRR
jgi:hypothetical protein